MALAALKQFIRQDVALDLGTANTLLFLDGQGVVLNKPTVIALDLEGNVVSLGEDAKAFLGKTPPRIRVIRPLRNGVIEDFQAAGLFLRTIIESARRKRSVFSSRIVICIPSQLTQVEKRSLLEAARDVEFKKIYLLEEVMAAAIGAGLDVSEKRPVMVVDIGGGTTEVAVIAEMAYLFCRSRKIAGDEMDRAIMKFILEEFGLKIGPNTAEKIKWQIGSAPGSDYVLNDSIEIAGQDVAKQIPASLRLTGSQVQKALAPVVRHVLEAVQDCVRSLSPELEREVRAQGILLTGGGSLLRGLPSLMSDTLKMKIRHSDSPLTTVVEGAGRTLSDFGFYGPVFVN